MSKEPDSPKREYEGSRFRIVHCAGALESYREALTHVDPRKAGKFSHYMEAQIKRLADGHRMSKANFPKEGKLPKQPGQQKAKYFYALKRIPIRGYCWLSSRQPNTYFISHYVYKNYDKLASADVKKVGSNWHRIEVDGNDY